MNLNLKGGVIIIGSLLWQDDLFKNNDNIRLNWRKSHLDFDNRIPVKLPIRYGRKSSSDIMTMVFSNRMARKIGFGYVVPFNKIINNIDELLNEASALSTAEGMGGDFVRSWGLLVYLLNDKLINVDQKKVISKLFKQQKKKNKINIDEYKVGRERSCVTKSLKLDISWIVPIVNSDQSKIDGLHFALATATKPLNRIPSKNEIAESIKSDSERRYFINNLTNGIITFEDFEISKFL